MAVKSVQITETPYVKYPRSVGFIISNEFCERFNYYGMRTILVLYLTRRLGYDDDMATVLYHIFTSLVYFFPLFGAIIADSYLGRFRTILYLSIVYAIGTVIISIGAIPILHLPAKAVTVIGLLLIATGTGGIKPCVSAFGGDQFKIPEQAAQLASFFSLFYFAINAGSLVSTSITPILREDVHCFGENDCFSLAFGVPAILMVISIFIFTMGKKLYVIKKPSGNMILSVTNCIIEAIRKRCKDTTNIAREHWLDYAEEKYGVQLISDTKALFKILILYLPLPLFWALFDQQGSRWTFQATRMVGDVGGGFEIKPDQIQVINPLLILLFIPLFDYAMYPILSKIGIKRPLQKITIGGLLAALAFILSGFIEMKLESVDTRMPLEGESQLRIFNGFSCNYKFTTNIPQHENFSLGSLAVFEDKHIQLTEMKQYKFEAIANNETNCPNIIGEFNLKSKKAISYFLTSHSSLNFIEYEDMISKQKSGIPLVRVLSNVPLNVGPLKIRDHNNEVIINGTELKEIPVGNYYLQYGNILIGNVELRQGGVYTFTIGGDELKKYSLNNYIINQPNSVHMLWQLPQYIVITAAEVMFSVTGLEFSYTQAPNRMKSVLQACWLLTVAFGNLLVVFIAEFIKFNSQAFEFFCFAALMILDMLIFSLLALKYTYVTHDGSDYDETDLDTSNNNSDQNINIKMVNNDNVNSQISSPNGHTNPGFTQDS